MANKRTPPPNTANSLLPLRQFLATHQSDTVRLSLAEIETILGIPLPQTAFFYREYWTNGAWKWGKAWMKPGWWVEPLLDDQAVLFVRNRANRWVR